MIFTAAPSRRRLVTEAVIVVVVTAVLVVLGHFIVVGEDVVKVVRVAALGLAWLAQLLFIAYFSRSSWRRHGATRALMAQSCAFWVVLSLALLRGAWPETLDVLRLGIILLLPYAILRLLYVLRREQIRASHYGGHTLGRRHGDPHPHLPYEPPRPDLRA